METNEDMVTIEAPSSEDEEPKGPLESEDTKPEGELESTPSSEEGTAGEGEPDVLPRSEYEKLQAQYEKAVTGYNELKSNLDRQAAELAQYRAAQEAAFNAQLADQDKYVDTLLDPQKGPQLVQHLIDQGLSQRDAAMQAQQMQIESMNAANELRNFATKEAGMSDIEYQQFIDRYRDATGVPFGAYHPEVALEMAKNLIKAEHHEHFAKKVKTLADKNADEKARRKLANALPSSTGAAPSGGPKTIADQYMEALDEAATRANPDEWLK